MINAQRLLLLAFLFFATILAACDQISPNIETPLPPRLKQLYDNRQLIVGTAITSPFEYHDPYTNELVGFDVDLANLIAGRLGVTVTWKEMAFADLLDELQEGHLDMVIAAMYIKPEREEIVDFSQPYLRTGLVMVVGDEEMHLADFADLEGATVGVKEGATGERWADRLRDEQGIDMTILRYESTLSSLDDLNAGLIDVAFNDELNTLEYIKSHPGIHIEGEVFDPAGLGIAVQAGDAEFLDFINDTLAELEESGEIGRLFDKWINPETAK